MSGFPSRSLRSEARGQSGGLGDLPGSVRALLNHPLLLVQSVGVEADEEHGLVEKEDGQRNAPRHAF